MIRIGPATVFLLATLPAAQAQEIVFVWDLYQAASQTGKFFRHDHLTTQTEAECKANAGRVRESVVASTTQVLGRKLDPILYCVRRPERVK
jgi:hypothetical protein